MKLISLVLPLYNEEQSIFAFWSELKRNLSGLPDYRFELLWINDGSTDKSGEILQTRILTDKGTNYAHKIVEFSRNFGHEAAMLAGLELSAGDAVICMDTDLQHPPQLISKMLDKFEQGAQIVLTIRKENKGQGLIKRVLSGLFYEIMNYLSEDYHFEKGASDFFLLDRQVVNAVKRYYKFSNLFIRGFIQNIGFKVEKIEYVAPPRIAGKSKYNFGKLLRLSMDAIFGFSFKPLRISRFFAVIYILFSLVLGAYTVYTYFWGEKPPSGYTTIVLFLSVSFAFLFSIISVLSFYFEKLIQEVRQKPNYIIKRIIE